MIGRRGDVGDLVGMLDAGQHMLVAGPRRIGKTTVCQAVCAQLETTGFTVVRVDVAESTNSAGLCNDIVRAYLEHGPGASRRLRHSAGKSVQKALDELGIPADVSALGAEALPATRRRILELPRQLTGGRRRVVLWLDELQRVADYDDAVAVLHDLADLYAGQDAVMVLIDGSDTRTFETLLGDSDGLGKLVRRHDLPSTIPAAEWRSGLTERFDQAEHPIEREALEHLIAFGAEQPYRTMIVARAAAFTADQLGGDTTTFEVRDAITSANQQLRDDGH